MKLVFKNSVVSFLSQIVTICILFITRKLSLQYFGVELLGISSTLTSLIGALSLADLGVQSAIVYRLYAPLKNNDKEKVNSIINIFGVVYKCVGSFILIAGIFIQPFLQYILKGVVINFQVRIILILLILNTSFSYFLSYKQTLLYADQHDYITKYVQMITNIVIGTLKIIFVIVFKNYYLYLSLDIMQTLIINGLVHILCKKYYPYIQKKNINRVYFKEIVSDVKQVFAAKLASYVYTSTDNIIISSFISSATVGYLSNYTRIISQLKVVIYSLLAPIIPFIGRNLVEQNNNEEINFRYYTNVRYLLVYLIGIPTYLLIDLFITICYGSQYILTKNIVILLLIDMYISFVYTPCYEYNNAAGLFKQEKKIMIIAALMNIIISIVCVNFIGMIGVLVGTVISQLYLWIFRSKITYKYCFKASKKSYIFYWFKNLYDIFAFLISLLICNFLTSFIHISNNLLQFIITGIVYECVLLVMFFLFHKWTREFRIYKKIIKEIFIKKI